MNLQSVVSLLCLYYVSGIHLQMNTSTTDTSSGPNGDQTIIDNFRIIIDSIVANEIVFQMVLDLSANKTLSFRDAIAVIQQIVNLSDSFFKQMSSISLTEYYLKSAYIENENKTM